MNRLQDSFALWTAIVTSPLLADVRFLFLRFLFAVNAMVVVCRARCIVVDVVV